MWNGYFNSRPCVRGDTEPEKDQTIGWTFQFTPLREGRRQAANSLTFTAKFQFTPLREGRHQRDKLLAETD